MRRTLIALGVGLGLAGSTAVAAPAQAAPPVAAVTLSTTAQAVETARFWLADGGANLAAATPYTVRTAASAQRTSTTPEPDGTPGQVVPLSPATEGEAPTTSGKVFFVAADGLPHWCTGSAVHNQYRNLVATAGHCVFDLAGETTAHSRIAFVPGYSGGVAPKGLYAGKQATAHQDLTLFRDHDRDFAFVNVFSGVVADPAGVLSDLGRLADNVGAQGFGWNQPPAPAFDVFGYPAGSHPDGSSPYTGQSLERSTGAATGVAVSDPVAERLVGVGSPFTGAGSLGSAWMSGYDEGLGLGYLTGVTMSVSDTDGDERYDTGLSPYFDREAALIFKAASVVWTGRLT
ncbi:hypothetical protein FAF44_22465 [Nonomuraea sp. MG754425]|uniref:trypsin-like serine peptidase n=1 Tax=Nonomuraea sp. MG754425 TaxID=2570319 RepID=UPI001F413B1F|nr:hypothetical protein [Nonomuraea sp. MG754425]MCF6471141.1 hypothetical protein [Nonomuraea sp. MG754425]